MARRIRAPIADLSEYGKRYKGKNVTRKEILVENSEDEEDDGSIEDEEEEDGDNDAEEDDNDESEEDEEDEEVLSKSTKKNVKPKDADKNGFSLINLNHNEELAKGKAVKNQLSNRFKKILCFFKN